MAMAATVHQPSISTSGSRLQQMLQSAVQAVQWTYSLFWQVDPQQGILIWGDGYYNGAIKTRKTVQPVEVSTEEASLHRSQQLRELYESLSAEETNQPARRPCAALSPEDLTESEWFYLMSVSFSFPPGVGLPGKAFVRQQHVWLTGANETDSKIFTRAILAKSARVQTVICIPLINGVIELGTTERVIEDLGLIQYVKSFFTDYHHPYPKPALSEHSTSNPAASSEHHFHSPSLLAMYSAAHPVSHTNQEEEEDDEEDDEDDEESGSDSDSQTETGRNSYQTATQDQTQTCAPISTQDVTMTQAAAIAEPSELVQLEMSEDIRLGSPDDGSNNLDPDLHMFDVNHQQRLPDPIRRWSSILQQDQQLCESFQLPSSEAPRMEELTQEDSHYSQTVSTILQQNSGRWPEYSSTGYVGFSPQSSFSKWSNQTNHLLHVPLEGSSQFLLKYILFHVPFLHNKYRDENSPKSRDGDTPNRLRKGSASQEDLSANHVLAERRRREKLNERFIVLRSLVPFVTKMDKASILGDTIEYVKQLRKKIQDLEGRTRSTDSGDQRLRGGDLQKIASVTKDQQRNVVHGIGNINSGVTGLDQVGLPGSDKRKVRIVERSGGEKVKVGEGLPLVGNVVQVSIIESDALLELKCVYREGLLLEIMQILRELRFEITAVQSSSSNGIFVAELRAKVKENIGGKKATIVEVKRAIHQILSHF